MEINTHRLVHFIENLKFSGESRASLFLFLSATAANGLFTLVKYVILSCFPSKGLSIQSFHLCVKSSFTASS